MERRERRLLLYAAHSGLGNQLVQLGSALLLAKLLNRTLVLPPILEHGEVAGPGRHGSCSGSAAAHATLARRALQLYQRHATANMRQRFDDVFDLSSYAVAPFRPGLQWAFDFSAQASLCEHTPRSTEWLRRLAGRTDELLMVGSLHYGRNVLLHALAQTRLAPPWSPRAQHHFAIEQASALTGDNGPPFVPPWNRSRFPHAAFSGFGAFACMYMRLPDAYARSTANNTRLAATAVRSAVASAAAAGGGAAAAGQLNAYVASNANVHSICNTLRPLLGGARCLTASDIPIEVRGRVADGLSRSTSYLLLDLFVCSQAPAARCIDYHNSTFWAAIAESHAQMESQPPTGFRSACEQPYQGPARPWGSGVSVEGGRVVSVPGVT